MRKISFHFKIWLTVFVLVSIGRNTNAQTKLLRFPDVYDDRIVFTYASDLWTVSTKGGMKESIWKQCEK